MNNIVPTDILYYKSNIHPGIAKKMYFDFCKKYNIESSLKRHYRDSALIRGIIMSLLISSGYDIEAASQLFDKDRSTAYYYYKNIKTFIDTGTDTDRRLFNLFMNEYLIDYDEEGAEAVFILPGQKNALSGGWADNIILRSKNKSVENIVLDVIKKASEIVDIMNSGYEEYLKRKDILNARRSAIFIYLTLDELLKRTQK